INISSRSPLILFNNIIYQNKIKGIHIFNELKNLVENLILFDQEYDDVLVIYILYKTCGFLGIKLNLNSCTKCDSRLVFSFSNESFGFVCKKHFLENYKILDKSLEILYLCSLKKFKIANNYEKNIKKIAVRILIDYINYHVGINLFSYLF
ncbi:MAG: DNA repair protein RecO C-terminal domain-containing protein, partial [Malacoplasma sp.]|nr:DNA repair protein RecO C-terminal domain-containing protein [Malacoplasma sp.]